MIHRTVLIAASLLLLASHTALAAEGNWSVFEFVDEWQEPTGKKGVRSKVARVGQKSAAIVFESSDFSTMRFSYLNLTGGSRSRYGNTETHRIHFKVGDREDSFDVDQPSSGEKTLWLRSEPTRFIVDAIREDAGEVLMVRMTYYSDGNVVFRFPLDGAKEALKSIGVIPEPGSKVAAEEAEAP